MSEFDEFQPSAEEIREAMDKIDLWLLELLAEAAEVGEWNQDNVYNFMRRAYARGRQDAFNKMLEEAGTDTIE